MNDTGIFDELKVGSNFNIPDPTEIASIAKSIGDNDFKTLAQTAIPALFDLSGVKSPDIPKEAWQLIDWIL